MRNFYIFLFITIFCGLVIYFVGNSLLQESLESRLKLIPDEMLKLGINMEPPSFESLKVNSSKSLSIKNVHTRFSLTNRKFYSADESFTIAITQILFSAQDQNYKKLRLTLEDITIQSVANDKFDSTAFDLIDSHDTIKFAYISTDFESTTSNPETATRALLEKVANYIRTGRLEIPIKFTGSVVLNRGDSLRLKLTENFEIDRASFDRLAGYHLNQAEIDFIAVHPLRAGTILELHEQSLALSKKVASSGADPQSVSYVSFFLNFKRKFGQQADDFLNQIMSDPKRKNCYELANDYYNKKLSNSNLIAIINEQGKNYPIKSKASYSVN